MSIIIYKYVIIIVFNLETLLKTSTGASALEICSTANDKKCLIPPIPLHTKYYVVDNLKLREVKAGECLPQRAVLETKCEKNYKLAPHLSYLSNCYDGEWIKPLAECLRSCPPLISTRSTKITCKHGRSFLENCNNPVEGTSVMLKCQPLYYEPDPRTPAQYTCKKGTWGRDITPCKPRCGVRARATTNIIGGSNAVHGDHPWQVALYNKQKEIQCGGSIIQRNLVLSAAHCVTDRISAKKLPAENYLIAAGNYYSQYNDSRDLKAQFSEVSDIRVPENYKGDLNYQDSDISVLVLTNPFIITDRVQLVCIELNRETVTLHSESKGIVTGWGYASQGSRNASKTLKVIEIPFISYHDCFKKVPSNYRPYIREDKICGGYINNSKGVCQGDSGGALVFHDSMNQYYVKGIVSTSPATSELQCDTNQYSMYTSVFSHISWLNDVVADYPMNEEKLYLEEDGVSNIHTFTEEEEEKEEENETITKTFRETCMIPNFPHNGKYDIVKRNNILYKPGDRVPKGSILYLTCNTTYISDLEPLNKSICAKNGEWEPPPPTCALCGDPTNVHSWHVGIYDKEKEFICGGSIISTKMILSAAQCFTNYDAVLQPAENYVVAAGKYFRAYYDDRDRDAQYSTILEINIPDNFTGRKEYGRANIAILILRKSFSLSRVVQPVCLDRRKSLNLDTSIYNNGAGEVTGWGYTKTTRKFSDELQEIKVIYTEKCYYKLPLAFQRAFTFDEICSEQTTDTDEVSVCGGDEGGGLVFYNLDDQRYYIKGIVSIDKYTDNHQCDLDKYGIYTSVDYYKNFLTEVAKKY